MSNPFKTKLIKSIFPYFLLAVFVIAAYKIIDELHIFVGFFKFIGNIITPFFYGFILAYILNIPCSGIQRLLGKSNNKFIMKRKKAMSIFSVYILFALTIYLVLNLVIPNIYESITHFVNNFQGYYSGAHNIQIIVDYVVDYVIELGILGEAGEAITMETTIRWVNDNFNILENISSTFRALFSVGSVIFKTFLAVVSSVFILFEKDKFIAYLSRMLRVFTSTHAYSVVVKYSQKLNKNFRQYINTQTIDGIILGTLVTIELYLMGSIYFLTLGIMLGIVNYIPYFGSIFGTLIAVVVVTLEHGWQMGLIATAVLFITQQIDGNIIQPKLMGESFKFSPLLVIISVTIGGAFAGVLGMVAAIPIVAVLKDMLEDIIVYYEKKKPTDKEIDPENQRRRKTDYADSHQL